MTQEEFNFATIKTQLSYLMTQMERLPKEPPQNEKPLPENITLELAAELKGGCSFNTYKSRYYLQPCGGTNSVKVGGRKCWRKQDVLDWLSVDDSKLDEYLKRFGVTIKKY